MAKSHPRECREDVVRDVADLGDVQWPPDPIQTERLLLRCTAAQDRDGYIELFCSDEVRRYLGGPLSRKDVASATPEVPGNDPGVFALEAKGTFVGIVSLDRRDPDRIGHLREHGHEIEVSFTLLPAHWRNGYGTEAVAAVLKWVDQNLPGEPVVLCTQSANLASVRLAERTGFVEQERFVEFGAEQWFGVRMPSDGTM